MQRSRISWDYPKYVVLDKKSGKHYFIVGATQTQYLLESKDPISTGQRDKKAVHRSDPNDRYRVVGYYD